MPPPPNQDRWRLEGNTISLVRPPRAARPADLEALPQPVRIDLARTALIVVDMQNDFLDPLGWFSATRGADPAPLMGIVATINALIQACRAAAVPVIHLNWAVRADLANLPANVVDKGSACGARPGYGDQIDSGDVLVAGQWGARSIPAIDHSAGDIDVAKHRLTGFRDNDLDQILRRLGVSTLIYTGINLDRCVFATLADGCFQGFDAVLVEDATATVSPAPVSEAILYLIRQMYGFTTTSAQLLAALIPPHPTGENA